MIIVNIAISNNLLGYHLDRLYFGDITGKDLPKRRETKLAEVKKFLLDKEKKTEDEVIFVYDIKTSGSLLIFKVFMFAK